MSWKGRWVARTQLGNKFKIAAPQHMGFFCTGSAMFSSPKDTSCLSLRHLGQLSLKTTVAFCTLQGCITPSKSLSRLVVFHQPPPPPCPARRPCVFHGRRWFRAVWTWFPSGSKRGLRAQMWRIDSSWSRRHVDPRGSSRGRCGEDHGRGERWDKEKWMVWGHLGARVGSLRSFQKKTAFTPLKFLKVL